MLTNDCLPSKLAISTKIVIDILVTSVVNDNFVYQYLYLFTSDVNGP